MGIDDDDEGRVMVVQLGKVYGVEGWRSNRNLQ